MEKLTESQPVTEFLSEKKAGPHSSGAITLSGYLLLAISAGLFGLEDHYNVSRADDNLTMFFVHYFIALCFVVILLLSKAYGIRRSWRKEHIHKTAILLNLFLVSAYALNKELPVFEDSVPWFCVYLVLTSAVMLSYHYFDRLPKVVNYVQYIVLGSALVLYLYMTIYVANFYMLGTVGTILVGIGAHIFVPVLLFVCAIRLLVIVHEKKKAGLVWVAAGAVVTIGFVAGFVVVWNARVNAIDRMVNQSVIHADTGLPVWVKVAQTVKNDWITERILKSRLVYTSSNNHFQWSFFPDNNNWDEKRKHDPLVFLASGSDPGSLSNDDRKNILKAITNSRHKAQERLWSGDNLITSYIVTDVDLYPELRIAYAEHYLNVRNNAVNNNRWWGNSEEAIYTFQLPEGSVVTSLSLWVNGKEEKAILTSKQKATEAYTTIVGRERRDPSVVHWQEGNTISVRVFPCTPQEERKFKIGVTSPLPVIDDRMVYKNVTFRGPNASSATQTSRLRVIGQSQHIEIPGYFKKSVNGEYISEREYDPDLIIAMDVTPMKANQFSFDGFTYSLSGATPVTSQVDFTDIYLDINNSWTPDEISPLYDLLKNYRVHAYVENDFVTITSENWEDIMNLSRQTNFSLFPFHHIKNTTTSLVITKGRELSPYLRDFRESAFAEGIRDYFATGKKVYVYNLAGSTSTYIKSLKELRAFHFAQGSITRLLGLLQNKTFPLSTESADRVVLHESEMVIQRNVQVEKDTKDNAPDHLARLFAYNNIMRQVGVNFFKDDFVNDKLVDEAATAYVVSPVSSLIVLETKEDYERFGIKDKDNSLHNATKNSSGAVPEPHEWALIIVFVLFIAFYVFRYKRYNFASFKK